MSEAYTAEIRMFAGSFAPNGWAFCNGQIMSIAQNAALFSLLGTTYGGNGTTNFALPNLNGRAPMHSEQGPGLTYRQLGEQLGTSSVTLVSNQMPAHSHTANVGGAPSKDNPTNAIWGDGKGRRIGQAYTPAPTSTSSNMNPNAIGLAGGSQPHNNMQPYLGVSFIICINGIFPSRS